ncbi:hypothetical protein SISNIDRAFT_553513 [Sistotremastrum niveocremeum HHB9708]|uniref:Ricin B lectin domain-containing protein n=1 Tax=Sistotremastrum niveocremeum HHB9708 TaxID=1314777 RepID=A0A164MEC6_9AGAM|nr:hypothetical protein SISNIDRAFT_553513 [Sistotremastrum niveocremeum HHB9708]
MLSSFVALASLFMTLVSPPAIAAPAAGISLLSRDVGITICNTSVVGDLSATAKAHHSALGFHLNKTGALIFDPNSKQELKLEFQPCTPNFGRFPNTNGVVEGHLFIPSVKKCLGITTVNGPEFPLSAVDCSISDDSSQVFNDWIQLNGTKYLWSGATQADGSLFQGSNDAGAANCTGVGLFGYKKAHSGLPPKGQVILQCANNKEISPLFLH